MVFSLKKNPQLPRHIVNVRIAFPSGETIFFSVSFAIPRHGFMLENKAIFLEKETPHSKARNPIVGGRKQTCSFFTLISEKLADFIIAVTGNRIECELREVRTCPVLLV